jgi:hypothetical protein
VFSLLAGGLLFAHDLVENALVFGVLAECLLIFIALQYWRNWANIREYVPGTFPAFGYVWCKEKTNATRNFSAAAK